MAQQEIRRRPGRDDRNAPPHALPVEGAVRLVRRDRALALVEHLHVAAERQRGDHPLGLVAAAAGTATAAGRSRSRSAAP